MAVSSKNITISGSSLRQKTLIDLLELVMSSDTAETVNKYTQLVNSGADPVTLNI